MVRWLALASALLFACSDETETSGAGGGAPDVCPPGERSVEGVGCVSAGVQDSGCLAGEVTLANGDCAAPGIPAGACATGFESDGDGCTPILPSAPCPAGQIAIPGETRCRAVAPCGSGKWGSIPVEPNTEYVDLAYTGIDSDGSALKPWTTLANAVSAAERGAIVAIAEGSYVEDVEVLFTPVRIWGKCPELVEIVGVTVGRAAVLFGGVEGSEIRDVALSGATVGVGVLDSSAVLVDSVWIHHTGEFGVIAQTNDSATAVTVSRSLIEDATTVGAFAAGATIVVENSVIRNTQPSADQFNGMGIVAQELSSDLPGQIAVHRSVIAANRSEGIKVMGSDAVLEATVVTDTQTEAATRMYGLGITALMGPTSRRSSVEVRSSYFARNRTAGLSLSSSDAVVEATVVEGTVLGTSLTMSSSPITVGRGMNFGEQSVATIRSCVVRGNQGTGILVDSSEVTVEATVARDGQTADEGGIGIASTATGSQASVLTIDACLLSNNSDVGVLIDSTQATVNGTLVRDTQPHTNLGSRGFGLEVQRDAYPSRAQIIASSFERNHEVGILVAGGEAVLDAVLVRDTQPRIAQDEFGGIGIQAQWDPLGGYAASLEAHDSLIERNSNFGVLVFSAAGNLVHTLIRDTQPLGGMFGDGLGVVSPIDGVIATGSLKDSRIERSARGGVSNFSANVALESNWLECNAIVLASEVWPALQPAHPATFDDLGNNVCSCSGETAECKAISKGLQPPQPLTL